MYILFLAIYIIIIYSLYYSFQPLTYISEPISKTKTKETKVIRNELILNSKPLLQYSDDINIYCINPISYNGIFNPFQQLDISIKTDHNNDSLSYFSIKGIAENEIDDIIEPMLNNTKVDVTFLEYLQNCFTSCSSPLLQQYTKQCIMHFNPYIKNCIVINDRQLIKISIEAKLRYNYLLPICLVVGILFLLMGKLLSNNILFQYLFCSILFILLGIFKKNISTQELLYSYYIENINALDERLKEKVILSFDNSYKYKRSNTFMVTFSNYLSSLCYFELTEIVFFYAIVGVYTISWMRSYEKSKSIMMITMKRVLRIIGIILVLFSISYPMVPYKSIVPLYFIIFFVSYTITALLFIYL